MTAEEIVEQWDLDCEIDRTQLDTESLVRTPKLHAKWYRIFNQEKAVLRKLEGQYKKLKAAKTQFLLKGPTEETTKMGWRLPASGKLIKTEVPNYLDVDPDMMVAADIVAQQVDLVKTVEDIIKTLSYRGNAIRNAIDFMRFKQGS